MKALVGAFNQEKALVGAFSVIVQPVVEPMDLFAALIGTSTERRSFAARRRASGRLVGKGGKARSQAQALRAIPTPSIRKFNKKDL